MKKLSLVLLFMFVLIGLVGCKSDKKESVFEKLENADNMTLVMTMTVPIFGELEITTKMDGDKEYVHSFMEEYYLSTENGVKYKYSKDESDNWMKEEYVEEEPEETPGEDIDPTEFKDSWFEKEDGKYILKSDYYDEVFGDEGSDVRLFEIEIEDDIYTINFKINADGFVINGNIIIKDIDNTTVELPTINQTT